jgi:hypothetical protein
MKEKSMEWIPFDCWKQEEPKRQSHLNTYTQRPYTTGKKMNNEFFSDETPLQAPVSWFVLFTRLDHLQLGEYRGF